MPKYVKSAKGEIIDFDLLKIKQDMISKPTPDIVNKRKELIDDKMTRRVKRAKDVIEEKRAAAQSEKQKAAETETKPRRSRKVKNND